MSGGIFSLISSDGRVDRMLMATELLNKRINEIKDTQSKKINISVISSELLTVRRPISSLQTLALYASSTTDLEIFRQLDVEFFPSKIIPGNPNNPNTINQPSGGVRSLNKGVTLANIEKTHIPFINAKFSRFSAIGYEYNNKATNVATNTSVNELQAQYTTNPEFGQTIKYSISRYGDFFADTYHHVSLAAIKTPRQEHEDNFNECLKELKLFKRQTHSLYISCLCVISTGDLRKFLNWKFDIKAKKIKDRA